MSEFDKHWNEWVIASNCTEDEAKIHFEAGQQSQQAKIDAITKQRDSFIKAHHIAMNDVCEHKAKIDELQARVDEAMKYIEPSDELSHKAYRDLVKILKGNKDESIREL